MHGYWQIHTLRIAGCIASNMQKCKTEQNKKRGETAVGQKRKQTFGISAMKPGPCSRRIWGERMNSNISHTSVSPPLPCVFQWSWDQNFVSFSLLKNSLAFRGTDFGVRGESREEGEFDDGWERCFLPPACVTQSHTHARSASLPAAGESREREIQLCCSLHHSFYKVSCVASCISLSLSLSLSLSPSAVLGCFCMQAMNAGYGSSFIFCCLRLSHSLIMLSNRWFI